jgi:hypothetical protein
MRSHALYLHATCSIDPKLGSYPISVNLNAVYSVAADLRWIPSVLFVYFSSFYI